MKKQIVLAVALLLTTAVANAGGAKLSCGKQKWDGTSNKRRNGNLHSMDRQKNSQCLRKQRGIRLFRIETAKRSCGCYIYSRNTINLGLGRLKTQYGNKYGYLIQPTNLA